MNDEIRREIRQILNEEIRSSQRPIQSSAMAMVSRTRNLIGQASESVASTSGSSSIDAAWSCPPTEIQW